MLLERPTARAVTSPAGALGWPTLNSRLEAPVGPMATGMAVVGVEPPK